MIRKIAVLARDRPLCFFAAGFSFLVFWFFFASAILAIVYDFSDPQPSGGWEILLVIAVFLPVLPVFYPLCFMFAEWYFNLLRIGWLIGLDKKPFLRWFLRLAGVEQREEKS